MNAAYIPWQSKMIIVAGPRPGDRAREYAEAGIPEYWIVDEHPTDEADGMVSVFRLELTDGGPRYLLRERIGVQELTSQRG